MAKYTNLIKSVELNKFYNNYTVIDLETTGLSPYANDIIEISAIKYRQNRKIAEYVTLVKTEQVIPTNITKLTGITNKMLSNAPDPRTAILGLFDFFKSDVLVGYNITFDLAFLNNNCDLFWAGDKFIKNNYVDVMNLTKRYVPSLGITKQINVAQYFGIGTKGSHRAGTDCEICNACYQKIREIAEEEYTAPREQIILSCKAEITGKKPFAGRIFFFLGILDRWYIKNIRDIVLKLGGIVQNYPNENVDIVIVGTAYEGILEKEDFQYCQYLKNSGVSLTIVKDVVFIKTLLERNYVEEFEDGEKVSSLFDQ